ncbi:unnamed protein product [Sphagnum balticum]
MQQMYRNFLTDLEKFGFTSQTRPRMRAFGRSVTRPKDSFSVVFEPAAKDDGKLNRQNPRALPCIEPVKNLLNGCSNGLLKPLLQPLSRFFTTICDLWFARDFRGQEKQ